MGALIQVEVEKMIEENKSFRNYEIAHIDLSDRVFTVPIDFGLVKFVGSVNFTGATFNERIDFSGAKFSNSNRVCFKNARFAKEVTFQAVEFPNDINEIDFSSTQFEKLADFRNIKFCRGINFFKAKFFEVADFSDCAFKKSVHFEYVQFAQAYFNFSTFCASTYFDHSQFNGTTLFDDVQFCKGVQFEGVRFLKDAIFEGKEGKTFFKDVSTYRYAKFSEEVIFRHINLEKVSFLNAAKLDRVHFINVEWPQLRRRKTVYDEAIIEAKEKYRAVENIYQQLKVNYESKGNYGHAGDFHYGEMEMRRRSLRSPICKNFSLTAFYKYLSGYGENPFLAFTVLMIFCIICAVFYFFEGIKVNNSEINYDLTWNLKDVFEKKLVYDFVYTLVYSIQKIFLLRDLTILPSGLGSTVLGTLQSILGPLQIALLGLAVKRRFKR